MHPDARRAIRPSPLEAAFAIAVFAALAFVVLSLPAQFAEPDDGAYHHSIVAIAMGDFLTLSQAQLDAVGAAIGGRPGVPNQWVELPNGQFISEKNAGYPYLAAPFAALGIIRLAPLFYGALACLGLFAGARRWLGRFGGAAAVGLFCSSGAAIAFAWRDYMPTFTDASLIAAGAGAVLWAILATEVTARRRTFAGLAAFVALEIATFARYTDVVILGCAVVVGIHRVAAAGHGAPGSGDRVVVRLGRGLRRRRPRVRHPGLWRPVDHGLPVRPHHQWRRGLAWLVTRIPGKAWVAGAASAVVVAGLFGLGIASFYAMYDAFGIPLS